jgi:putative intracellular protease/amidase
MPSTNGSGSDADKLVLIVLYDGFMEYEYELIVLALHHNRIPFEVVGLERREVSGALDMRTKLPCTLEDIDVRRFSALVLPGLANGILRTDGVVEPVDQQAVFADPRIGGFA